MFRVYVVENGFTKFIPMALEDEPNGLLNVGVGPCDVACVLLVPNVGVEGMLTCVMLCVVPPNGIIVCFFCENA